MIPVSVAPHDLQWTRGQGSFGTSLASQLLYGRHEYRVTFWHNVEKF